MSFTNPQYLPNEKLVREEKQISSFNCLQLTYTLTHLQSLKTCYSQFPYTFSSRRFLPFIPNLLTWPSVQVAICLNSLCLPIPKHSSQSFKHFVTRDLRFLLRHWRGSKKSRRTRVVTILYPFFFIHKLIMNTTPTRIFHKFPHFGGLEISEKESVELKHT